MADIEDNAGAVERVDNSSSPSTAEPPAIATTSRRSLPPATTSNADQALAEMNQKIGNMADLIGKLCTSLDERDSTRATGRGRSPSRTRRQRSPSSSSDSSNEALDDQLSVRASEDELDELINGGTSSTAKHSEKDKNGAKSVPDSEVLLAELEANLNEDDKQGPAITKKLADMVHKRWGKKLEQIKSLLAKHEVPENCSGLRAPRVNLEVWQKLNSHRRTADLRLHNTQKTMIKAMSAVLYMCDRTLASTTVTKDSQKAVVGEGIDAMALLSHAIADLSCLRREQMKPALSQEIHSLCTNELPEPSAFLFGEDLAKQIRDAREVTRIGKAIAGPKSGKNRSYKHRHADYQRQPSGHKRPHFLSKGQKTSFPKKKKYQGKDDFK